MNAPAHNPAHSPGQAPTHAATSLHHLAEVVSVEDVASTGRIRIRLLGYDGVDTQDAPIEARLCVPFAGAQRGAFLVPDVGDEVVVAFINGDERQPVVIGGVWNGRNLPDEALGADRVDRWTFVGKRGTRIAIVEADAGARIELSTRSGGSDVASITIDRESNGSITLSAGGSTLTLDSQGLSVRTSGACELQSSTTTITAASVSVDAGVASFSGLVTASGAVQSPAILGSSYTPGAGNVW